MPKGSTASATAERTGPLRPVGGRTRHLDKPAKPYPDFPLFPHDTRRWAKKIRGRFAFFGPWEDPMGALTRYLEQRDALMAGLVPRPGKPAASPGGIAPADPGLTLRDLVNHFLTAKQRDVDRGELGQRSFADYHVLCRRLIAFFGASRLATDITPDDFGLFRQRLASTRGPLALSADITKTKGLFPGGQLRHGQHRHRRTP